MSLSREIMNWKSGDYVTARVKLLTRGRTKQITGNTIYGSSNAMELRFRATRTLIDIKPKPMSERQHTRLGSSYFLPYF